MKRHQHRDIEDFYFDHDTLCGLWVDDQYLTDRLVSRKNSCKNCLKIIKARRKKTHKRKPRVHVEAPINAYFSMWC